MISRYPMQPITKCDMVEVNNLAPDDDDMPVNYDLIVTRQIADPTIQQKSSQRAYITTNISGHNLLCTMAKLLFPTAWLYVLSVGAIKS